MTTSSGRAAGDGPDASILPSERIFSASRRRRSRAVCVAFTVVVVCAWLVYARAQSERRIDAVRNQVEAVRDEELRAVERWADAQLADARYWSSNPSVVAATQELLETAPGDLIDSPAQTMLRDRLAGFLELNALDGYFVVRPDGASLASSRNANVGTRNLVAIDHPDAFARILAGDATITPPQLTDVPLSDDGELTETMFVGAPIVDDGEVLGAFMLRVEPSLTIGQRAGGDLSDERRGDVVFSRAGIAVTGSDTIAPLDEVTIDGRNASELFESQGRGTNIPPGTSSEVDRVEAWAVSPELGLGVLTLYDGDTIFSELRAERRTSVALAAFITALGAAFVLLAHHLASGGRARELDTSHRRFRSLVDPSPDPALRVRPNGAVIAANEALRRMLLAVNAEADDLGAADSGDSDDAPPMTVAELATRHPILQEIAEHWSVVVEATEPLTLERMSAVDDGIDDRYYRVRFVPVATGTEDHEILILLTDVTGDVERELRLESLVLTDPLTGLCNRTAIHDRLAHALARLSRPSPGDGLAVIVIDLDHFKPINDAFGHAIGDQVLIATGRALSGAVRDQDSLGRVGGDEFVVVCEQVADLDAAEVLTRRLAEVINSLVVETDVSALQVTGSVGVAWTDTPTDLTDIFARADRAMLLAKQRRGGEGFTVSRPSPSGSSIPDVERDRWLFGALGRDEFEMHYQPVVDPAGNITGAEALLRWNHPRLGVLSPADFLPSLMQSGSIGAVGRWGVAEALAQAARWRERGAPIDINVNISPFELSAGTIDVVEYEVDRLGLDPSTVCVEITEHAFEDDMLTSGAIARLGDLGVQIALDDFGTGSSTLSQLRQRPLHWLKLDRSFVASIDGDPASARLNVPIIRAIIGLAEDFDLGIVAEGVETIPQIDWLYDAGCTRFQGWAFGAAVPVTEFDPFVQLVATGYVAPSASGPGDTDLATATGAGVTAR